MKLTIMALMCAFSPLSGSDRYYIDSDEISNSCDSFHIHIGGNNWIETNVVCRDSTGLYTFTKDIVRKGTGCEYEKRWRCPYCHQYWPIGIACQNGDCPSKYKY